jgi:hypothetical protein
MTRISKFVTGAAAAALMAVSTATPAMARHGDGIDTGDVIAGVAIIGGVAAIAAALSRDGNSYGYDYRSRYRGGYTAAVSACGYQAERYGRGRVQIVDVDRRGNDRFRVRGVIDGGNSGYGNYGAAVGYDRYDRDDRYGYGDDNRYGYDRSDRYGRMSFSCTARGNGRVTDFDIDRGARW